MASQSQKGKSSLGLVLLLLLLFGLLFLPLSSIHVQTNTATQTNSEGQCLSNGQDFDEQQEAFTLAQMAEQYRSAHPYGEITVLPRILFVIRMGRNKDILHLLRRDIERLLTRIIVNKLSISG